MESTISMSVVVLCLVACVMTTLVPVIVSVVLLVRKRLHRLAYLLGFLGFFVSQIVIRIPILSVLSTVSKGFSEFYSTVLGSILIGGLSAGLFEETARLIGAKVLLKKDRLSFKDGISFGVGHALCEVIIVVGITYLTSLVAYIMINTNSFYAIMVSSGVTEAQYDEYLKMYTSVQAIDFVYGLAERCSAIMFHIANTLIVFYSVVSKKYGYYALAVLLHTLFNSLAVVLSAYCSSYLLIETVLLAMAVAMIYLASTKLKPLLR